MTVDVRWVNHQVDPVVWPMPILETEWGKLKGCQVMFSFDFFKGFWQFAVDQESQEYYSFQTSDGIFTPNRVLMGGCDSVAYVQSTVQKIFEKWYNRAGCGVLIWIDDILGYGRDEDELLQLLGEVLARCQEVGLKLNPKKCKFYQKKRSGVEEWCQERECGTTQNASKPFKNCRRL